MTDLTAAERRAIREAAEAYAASDDDPDCARIAATLRRLLERAERDTTPPRNGTPAECTVPPEWLQKPYWVDPPEGWRYGFPKLYDPATDGNMTAWLIANGYPKRLARQGLPCTFTAQE